ncbi:hypothetical protein CGG78_11000 [Vibrio parahaemolyticus]|uniref:Uncharacterized protein n=1 Tax=Vibrio diabolicus TaxID=50719 RepID=A0ABM6SH95_9VIBR|nr:hypothetical protein AL468_22400 [Vibrio diabolicus]PWT55153.1 hypothetical protein CTT36_02135 [Vibrio parahaemolyticus]TOE42883.1 hypothetical protein CGJ43_02985 [Vibrio parahaemolyticus]TOJ12119.1 hypothetical protein CGI46_04795 [Vibrio parahaemolyticus]TOL43243.1 hypothetical protein CGH98_23250 [Vibrio parahaemolyticus]
MICSFADVIRQLGNSKLPQSGLQVEVRTKIIGRFDIEKLMGNQKQDLTPLHLRLTLVIGISCS